MIPLLKFSCLAIYAAGLAAIAGALPPGFGVIAWVAIALLGAHALEALLVWRLLRRHPGGMAVSVGLTLLYGFLHWAPLRRGATAGSR